MPSFMPSSSSKGVAWRGAFQGRGYELYPYMLPQVWAIWATTWHLFVGALPFKLINDASTFVGPVFLNLLLGVVSAGQSSTLGYSYAALMFVGLVLGTLCDNQHFQRVMRAGARSGL